MAHYIDKDALVAEIEKTIDEPYPKHDQQCDWEDGYCSGLYKALSIIEDTIEVKEVELDEHQIADIIQNLFPTDQFIESETLLLSRKEAILFAKHFFELGFKAQKGE